MLTAALRLAMLVFTVILYTSAATRCSKPPASILEFICWFLMKRLCVCFCLRQKFCWQWCDYYWGLGIRRNLLENRKRNTIRKRCGEGSGGNVRGQEYWQRMKSGWLTWKVNVYSVKMLMDWAALLSVCGCMCVCVREGRVVNTIVFAHMGPWIFICAFMMSSPQRDWYHRTADQRMIGLNSASLWTVHENFMCEKNKIK